MEKILIIIGAIMVMFGLATSFIIVEDTENGHIAVLLVALFVAVIGAAVIHITLIYSYKKKQDRQANLVGENKDKEGIWKQQ